MTDLSQIKEHADVIGADGVHVGTVDHVQGHRIKLTKKSSGDERHHYISTGLDRRGGERHRPLVGQCRCGGDVRGKLNPGGEG